MSTATKKLIIEELKHLPDEVAGEILDFMRFLKYRKESEKTETHLASENTLARDWERPEEDEAWKDL